MTSTFVPILLLACLISCASAPEAAPVAAPVAAHHDPELDSDPKDGKTKYQIIVDSFDRASRRPEVNDFDSLDEFRLKTRCFMTQSSAPDSMSEVVIRQMPVTRSGTPSYGPLFPGERERVETVLVLGKNTAWVNSANLTNEKRQVFEVHSLGSTLVIRINENQFGIYEDFGNPAEIWLRKGIDGNIFFKVFKIDAGRNRNEASVGYCFRM
ncbi:MAG: hypothetical protein KGP28_01355 [Bdellovibrionales bacterium]|nr:hypothetical protein [Bdellovibrionales bacterium]